MMDYQKEREAFESVFTETRGWDLTFIMGCYQNIETLRAFAGWQAAKAQAVPEGFGDIQSWIAVNSFSALDASIVDFPVVDANELAEFIDSLNIDVAVPEGFVEKTESNTHHYFKLKDWDEWTCINGIKDAITSDYDINAIVEVECLEVIEINNKPCFALLAFGKRHGTEVKFFNTEEEAIEAQEPTND